jgi:hypothetical protein
VGREKKPARLGRRWKLAAATDGGRVAHKKSTLLVGINQAAGPPIVTTGHGTRDHASNRFPQHH